MSGEVLLGGFVVSLLMWVIGSALGRLWKEQDRLSDRVGKLTERIARLETQARPDQRHE
jgi:hypothetical protein